MERVIKYGLFVLILFSYILFLLSTFLFYYFNYEEFTDFILITFNKQHKYEEFKLLISSLKYDIIRYALTFFLVIISLLFNYLIKKKNNVVNNIVFIIHQIIYLLQNQYKKLTLLTLIQKITLLAIIFSAFFTKLYFINIYPIEYDEAWTYMNFSSKSIFVSATYYPAPNNHILNSILTNISLFLPFNDKIAIRLPNLFISILTILLLFLMLQDYFDKDLSLIITALYSFSYPIFTYSILARGYLLIVFATILTIYSILKIIDFNNIRYWVIFCVGNIVGFYAISSFLFSFISAAICLLLFSFQYKNLKIIKRLFITSLCISIITLILYSPILFVNGLNAIIHVPARKGLEHNFSNILTEFNNTTNWFFGTSFYLFNNISLGSIIVILLMCLLFLLRKRGELYNNFAIIYIIYFTLPFLFVYMHPVIPYIRTWVYLSFIIGLAIIVFINPMIEFIKNQINLFYFHIINFITILIFIFMLTSHFNSKYNIDHITDFKFYQVIKKINFYSNLHFYTNYDYYDVHLCYYSQINNLNLKIDRHNNFNQKIKYDYLIIQNPVLTVPDSVINKYYEKTSIDNDHVYKYKTGL